ncbi:Cytochrome P450 [Amycolatopsis xylanica]|uniref:Cytochrome P450 n=1 Tax=Amycolatopsis xylanica TaxID=589385 RepID=A0A1H3J4R7_9PSEU|nr:cytochrome P450 [Amycolatopsis xylanica]SDY34983.1 Cytochrome P450 [Amycolatopsis xylanica]
MTLRFDTLDPDFIQNPYPFYRRLRERAPVHFEPALGGWMITRHQDVQRLLRHPRLKRSSTDEAVPHRVPDDSRTRRLVDEAFTRPIVDAMWPRIHRLVERQLDLVADAPFVELLADFAEPLAALVRLELLGVPAQAHETILAWFADIAPVFGRTPAERDPIGVAAKAADATAAFSAYLEELVEIRRREPRPDLLSRLTTVRDDDGPLSENELIRQVLLLLVSGTETTVHYLGNAVHTLLRHPDKADELRADPEMIDTAAEELLRYDGPVSIGAPLTTADCLNFAGYRIRPGDLLYPVLGAANRDPRQFRNPESLDLRRPVGTVFGFGCDNPCCLGATLARMEVKIALTGLLRRFAHLRLDEDAPAPVYRPDPLLRGLVSLPVRVDAPVPA